MTEITVLLINLDSSPDRLKAAETALAAQATACMRIPAIDGRHTPVEDVPTYDAAATLRYFGRALNGGEVGAFQSHLRALSTFLDSGAPYGLILEDDMDPDAQAIAFVSGILAWQKARWQEDWHVVNLGAKRQKLTSPLAVLETGGTSIEILRGHYFPMLATALLWTRSGAEAFLAQHIPDRLPLGPCLAPLAHADQYGADGVATAFPDHGCHKPDRHPACSTRHRGAQPPLSLPADEANLGWQAESVPS
ncbi:MAG: glycosyltransferase family 25 protein [Pseudomonadota bacterium]